MSLDRPSLLAHLFISNQYSYEIQLQLIKGKWLSLMEGKHHSHMSSIFFITWTTWDHTVAHHLQVHLIPAYPICDSFGMSENKGML